MIFSYLVAAFILLPVAELWVLFRVNEHLGLGPTLLIVMGTGFVGAWLARAQGFMIMLQIQRDLAEGRMPAPRLIDGAMILVAGAFLVTPGLITDTAGFLLLMPPVRVSIRMWLKGVIERKLRNGSISVNNFRM
jgi:UPF0716 protein FxsA